jgi:hypothetical protein
MRGFTASLKTAGKRPDLSPIGLDGTAPKGALSASEGEAGVCSSSG